MQSLLNSAERVPSLYYIFGWREHVLIGLSECYTCLQRLGVPSGDEHGKDCLITAWCESQEIDNWYSIFESFAKPLVVNCIRILAHEGIIDCVIAFKNLAIDLTLIVVPNLSPWPGKNGSNRQQV